MPPSADAAKPLASKAAVETHCGPFGISSSSDLDASLNDLQSGQGVLPISAEGSSSKFEPATEKSSAKEENEGPVKRRRKSSAGEGEGSQRVQLACFYCRTKRIRCSGVRPICLACAKVGVKCDWPTGRRRKRTRKEMEEAKRLESAGGSGGGPSAIGDPALTEDDQSYTADLTFDPDFWPMPALNTNTAAGPSSSTTFSNFVWPSGFTPEDTQPAFSLDSGLPDPGVGGVADSTLAQWFSASPTTDMRLITVLENQAAYIEGNPAEDKDLELYYYRFSGSTAIHPGINRISLKLQRRSADSPITAAPQPEPDDSRPPSPTRRPAPELFDQTGMPYTHVWQPLFALFFKHMSQHFPSVSRQRMFERFETGTMSQFLANCICAVGARFAAEATASPTAACAPFIAKAQELIIPLLHLPAYDVTTGLLLLSWANYGQSSESGLWQYSGMAIRMAIDIGVHENSEIFESSAHRVRTRLLFWSLFVTDRIVAFATGRPASIPEDLVEVPLPEDEDFFPDPARNTPTDPVEPVEPVPYVYLVRLMIICGRISNVLNGRRGKARTLVSTTEPLSEQLAELQMRLVQFVSGLPESMKWTVDNFKHHEARSHGGTFLGLHLWAHAVLALIYHPELLKSPSGIETPLNMNMNRNVKLSLASSRQICECMVFADLVSQESFVSAPFIVQPLYVAAMALIHEMRSAQAGETSANGNSNGNGSGSSNPTDLFLISMARQNFSALFNAIAKMEQYWAGANYVASLLEKRSGFARARRKQGKKTFISLPDKGLLRRFTTDPSHPNNVAAPTDTSLRDSMSKVNVGPSPYWLADLMAGYTIENMSFGPADSLDLERLLATGGFGMPIFGASDGSGILQPDRTGAGGLTGYEGVVGGDSGAGVGNAALDVGMGAGTGGMGRVGGQMTGDG